MSLAFEFWLSLPRVSATVTSLMRVLASFTICKKPSECFIALIRISNHYTYREGTKPRTLAHHLPQVISWFKFRNSIIDIEPQTDTNKVQFCVISWFNWSG